MRGAADTTLQKDMKETQPLVFQPLTSPFDFLTVENEILNFKFRNTKHSIKKLYRKIAKSQDFSKKK